MKDAPRADPIMFESLSLSELVVKGAVAGATVFLAVYAAIVVRALWSVAKPPAS